MELCLMHFFYSSAKFLEYLNFFKFYFQQTIAKNHAMITYFVLVPDEICIKSVDHKIEFVHTVRFAESFAASVFLLCSYTQGMESYSLKVTSYRYWFSKSNLLFRVSYCYLKSNNLLFFRYFFHIEIRCKKFCIFCLNINKNNKQ